MIHVLENEFLRVKINDLGAELCSIYDKEKDREVLWQADPAFWGRHAPVLFPNVGKHYGNHYRINEKEYPSAQHGFARDMTFTCTDACADRVTHQLSSDASTRENYPFDFCLLVRHELSGRKLTVFWEVSNTGDKKMYFTIGGHPAFRVPVIEGTSQSDYRLSFNNEESLTYYLIDPASGTAVTDRSYTLSLENGTCPITEHMFDKDALIFDEQITRAGFLLPDGTPYLEMSCEGFPSFGVWAAPGAPFVCLEPWMGRCDDFGFDKDLSQKPYINMLEAGENFKKDYSITVF